MENELKNNEDKYKNYKSLFFSEIYDYIREQVFLTKTEKRDMQALEFKGIIAIREPCLVGRELFDLIKENK